MAVEESPMQTGQRRLLVTWLAVIFGHEAGGENQSHHRRDGMAIGNGREGQEMVDDRTRGVDRGGPTGERPSGLWMCAVNCLLEHRDCRTGYTAEPSEGRKLKYAAGGWTVESS
jgi:hypothetical protein